MVLEEPLASWRPCPGRTPEARQRLESLIDRAGRDCRQSALRSRRIEPAEALEEMAVDAGRARRQPRPDRWWAILIAIVVHRQSRINLVQVSERTLLTGPGVGGIFADQAAAARGMSTRLPSESAHIALHEGARSACTGLSIGARSRVRRDQGSLPARSSLYWTAAPARLRTAVLAWAGADWPLLAACAAGSAPRQCFCELLDHESRRRWCAAQGAAMRFGAIGWRRAARKAQELARDRLEARVGGVGCAATLAGLSDGRGHGVRYRRAVERRQYSREAPTTDRHAPDGPPAPLSARRRASRSVKSRTSARIAPAGDRGARKTRARTRDAGHGTALGGSGPRRCLGAFK